LKTSRDYGNNQTYQRGRIRIPGTGIGNIMVDAEKLWIIAEIETISREAKANNHDV